jgi:hypothetical protein
MAPHIRMMKSVISDLTGILVREGKLKLDEPTSVAARANANDPCHAITSTCATPRDLR